MKNAECRIIKKLAALLACCLLLCGCAGLGDWEAPLVGNYALWRLSGHRIALVRERESGNADTVINALIYRVTWNEEFIFVQRTDPPETGEDLPIAPEVDYYILRVSDGLIFGPYTAAEYKAQCEALGVSGLPYWVYAQDLRP